MTLKRKLTLEQELDRKKRMRKFMRGLVITLSIVVLSFLFGAVLARGGVGYAMTSDEKWGQAQTLNEIAEKVGAIRDQLTEMSVHDKITFYALKHDVDPDLAHYIARNESQYNEKAVGDLYIYHKGKPVYSRGVFQLSQAWYGDVSNECAFDVDCASEIALPLIKDKKTCISQWTTCRAYYRSI